MLEERAAQWREEIMQRGVAQGFEQGASRMLALGKLTDEEIADGFGVSLEEVRALAQRGKGRAEH